MSNYLGKLQQLLCLLTCVLMVVAVSIRRDGKVVGRNVKNQQTVSQKADPMVVLEDGSALLNTSELGKDIVGYGGNVPLEITLREGRVENIRALANSETPDFFRLASALLTKWNGQTIEDAQKIGVDSAGHHAGHGIRLSAFWQEIILLHACVSLRFFAGTCREVRRI
ncbi:FMN-binding protein [uncultured Prevotella sp.]|uniref:FMN-binding protein n=1 Tax=uncultured Prevotella sp. TaxID=159272 RepID=UPI0034C6290A